MAIEQDLEFCYRASLAAFDRRLHQMALAYALKWGRLPAVLQYESAELVLATCDPEIFRTDQPLDEGLRGAAERADREWRAEVPFEPDAALLAMAPVGDEMYVRVDAATDEHRAFFRRRLEVALDADPLPDGN